jgi:hypothetical protein
VASTKKIKFASLGLRVTKINPKTIADAKTQKSHGIELNDASVPSAAELRLRRNQFNYPGNGS